MRLNFLQMNRGEVARARIMARYLSITDAQAVGMVLLLKEAALEVAVDGDLSGTIPDEAWMEWVAAAVGWDVANAGAIGAAMARCGFAIALPSGRMAVASLEVYEATAKTSSARSEAGKRGAAKRWGKAQATGNDGKAMAPDGNTEKETETEKEKVLPAVQEGPVSGPPPAGQSVDADLDAYVERGLREASGHVATQPPLVDVPPSPPRATAARAAPQQRTPTAPRTTPEEREAKKRVEEVHENVTSKPYAWGAEDWTALRRCLDAPCADGDLDELEQVWSYALQLGTTWPGCMRLRELASKWTQLQDHRRKANAPPDNPRLQRQQVGGDVPRVAQVARMYGGQG